MTFQYHGCPVLVSEGALHFSTVTYNWCSLSSSTFSPSLLCLAPLASLNLCTTCKSLEQNLPVLPTSMQKGRGGTCKGVTTVSMLGGQVNWCGTVWAILPCEVSLFSAFYKRNGLDLWSIDHRWDICKVYFLLSLKPSSFLPLTSKTECGNCPFPLVHVVSYNS